MTPPTSAQAIGRFGPYELDVRSGEVRKFGIRLNLGEQPLRILILLTEHPGELMTREELRLSLWSHDTFVDFDRSLNSAVQRLRETLSDTADKARWIETVPRRGYRFVGAVEWSSPNGSAPAKVATIATILSTDEPVERPLAELPAPSVPASRFFGRLWLAAVVVPLLAAALATAWAVRRHAAAASEPIHSLAVLPLDNLSGDSAQDYFTDGMTDELTTMLAKNSTLRITSRTSVMQYKGAHRPLPEIARALGVDGILEGSVSRSGDKVHMTVQLIHAPTDSHVWAESYDRDARDLLSLPGDVAQAIAKRLNSAKDPVRPSPARYVSPEAHDAYLRGRYLWFTGNNEKCIEYFRKAVELQPDYALGWTGISIYYGAGAIEGILDPGQSLPQEKAAALKAVELDDQLAEGHEALAAAIFTNDWNWDGALQEITRAIQLEPKYAEAYHFRAKILSVLNRHEEAIAAQKAANEIDPVAKPWALGLSYLLARQFDAAIAEARQRLESNPNDPDLHSLLSFAYEGKGMEKESEQEIEKELLLTGDAAGAAAARNEFAKGGSKAIARWQLGQIKKRAPAKYASPVQMAYCYARLGQREETIAMLEEGFRQHAPDMLWIQSWPALDFLHGDERYRAIVKGMGLPLAY